MSHLSVIRAAVAGLEISVIGVALALRGGEGEVVPPRMATGVVIQRRLYGHSV